MKEGQPTGQRLELCSEIEEEAEEQDGEVRRSARRSTYTDDDGYIHETEVRVRMVRLEEDTSPSEEDEDEGSESENADYGSLAEHLEADSEDEYIRLEGEEYQRYRMEMIEIDRGIEVYLTMKIREFKDMIEENPGDEDLPEGVRTFKNLERIISPWSRREEDGDRSPEILSLRQYTFHVRRGDESMDVPLGESEYPDGWVAAHYGPPLTPDEREGDGSPEENRSEDDEDMPQRAEEDLADRPEEGIEEPEPET